jgi:hypothetical protein
MAENQARTDRGGGGSHCRTSLVAKFPLSSTPTGIFAYFGPSQAIPQLLRRRVQMLCARSLRHTASGNTTVFSGILE